MLEKMFKFKENNTNVKTEVIAGLTTFMTMAYILAVKPEPVTCCWHGSYCSFDCNLSCILYRNTCNGFDG